MPSAATKIQILVVDDHPTLREGIRAIVDTQPDMAIIGEAADAGLGQRDVEIVGDGFRQGQVGIARQ